MSSSPDPASAQDGAPATEERPRGRHARHVLGVASRYRVIFAGPVGVGKTTAVRALTDVAPVDTDVPLTGGERGERSVPGKTTTTVGIDYGVWKPTSEISVALVGTPGQDRFQNVRAAVLAPHARVVLWVFGGDGDDVLIDEVRRWLEGLGSVAAARRVAIAVTRTTDEGAAARAALAPLLTEHGAPLAPIRAVDPRSRDDVMRVVSAALDLPEETR